MTSLDPPAWAALDLRLQVPQRNFCFKAIPASVPPSLALGPWRCEGNADVSDTGNMSFTMTFSLNV